MIYLLVEKRGKLKNTLKFTHKLTQIAIFLNQNFNAAFQEESISDTDSLERYPISSMIHKTVSWLKEFFVSQTYKPG